MEFYGCVMVVLRWWFKKIAVVYGRCGGFEVESDACGCKVGADKGSKLKR